MHLAGPPPDWPWGVFKVDWVKILSGGGRSVSDLTFVYVLFVLHVLPVLHVIVFLSGLVCSVASSSDMIEKK